KYTNGGLAWLDQWGSLRYSANTAFLAGVYSDTVKDYSDRYSNFAESQIDYILGDNPNDFSYMVGFGDKYALQPHHRGAHGGTNINDPAPNDHILYGALVGGPSSPNDNAYTDSRSNYITNEVALDYNAGFTGALARMYDEFGGQPLNTLPTSDVQLNIGMSESLSSFGF
ncbi:MAG: glycoside hydrolase family 9 protein, partial [Coleofasciculus sp. S288]|nr:glycoside hydrolase family 9 protein [Coleofasciculus sp. S288]